MITNGIEKVEWAVHPRGRSREAKPLKATLRTINPFDRMPADKVFHKNVLLVPHIHIRKKIYLIQT